MIGKTLSHYEVTAKLGEGGMGEVYLAYDIQLERKVALKVLPAELSEDPERLHRLRREAKALAALDQTFDRCLEKDPEQRYSTAAALRTNLEDRRRDLATGTATLSRSEAPTVLAESAPRPEPGIRLTRRHAI